MTSGRPSPALVAVALAALLTAACESKQASEAEAGVGSDRTGCGEAGTHSVEIGAHSCACEPGYDWCDAGLTDFECCPADDGSETGDEMGTPPDAPCGADELEDLACVEDPESPGPADAAVWACNGERWVEAPGYATFACIADGFSFAFGCLPGGGEPAFLCGYGPGNSCDPEAGGSVCVDEDIIDTCVWGRRTIDRCSRLCTELGAFGPGFASGACVEADPPDSGPASCACEP